MRQERISLDLILLARNHAWALALVGLLLLAACRPGFSDLSQGADAPSPTQDARADAEAALINFFSLLESGQYAAAVELYGGSYESLESWNPATDPNNHAELLQNGCTINGLKCLRVRDVESADQPSPGDFVFLVEFETPEGELFIMGPCCGADETEQPPVSQWPIRVRINDEGHFLVMDLPPYSP